MKKICLCLILVIFLAGCRAMDYADDVVENPKDHSSSNALAESEADEDYSSSDTLAEPEADIKGCNITKKPKGCKVFDNCNMLQHVNRAITTNSLESWECLYATRPYMGDGNASIVDQATGNINLLGVDEARAEMGKMRAEYAEINDVLLAKPARCIAYLSYYDAGRENLAIAFEYQFVEKYSHEFGINWISLWQIVPGDVSMIAALKDWVWAWAGDFHGSDVISHYETRSAFEERLHELADGRWLDCESGKAFQP